MALTGLSDAEPVVIERAGWWKPLTHGIGPSPMSCRLKSSVERAG